jgi:hypothetical protein
MVNKATWRTSATILAAVLLTACSSDPKPPPPLLFEVSSNPQANNGSLFYFVVRTTNDKQFMLENYQDIADKAFIDPPEASFLGSFAIVPGTKQECKVNLPAQGSVALYFLLT